jgi:hypothetical protein
MGFRSPPPVRYRAQRRYKQLYTGLVAPLPLSIYSDNFWFNLHVQFNCREGTQALCPQWQRTHMHADELPQSSIFCNPQIATVIYNSWIVSIYYLANTIRLWDLLPV